MSTEMIEHVLAVAKSGAKHAKSDVFPIDRMEQCLNHIIHLLEIPHGNEPT